MKGAISTDGPILRAEDPLLLAFLEGFPHGFSHLPQVPREAAWINNSNGLAHAYLTFVSRVLFRIHRIPGFGDRCLQRSFAPQMREFFVGLTPQDIERSVADLRRLYEHTQHALTSGAIPTIKPFLNPDGVHLFRTVRNDQNLQLALLTKRAENQGQDTIRLAVDTLSSCSLYDGYTHGLMIHRRVPVQDVLICNKTVAMSGDEAWMADLEGEWIVVNRDPRGSLDLRLEDVVIARGYEGCRLNDTAARAFPVETWRGEEWWWFGEPQ